MTAFWALIRRDLTLGVRHGGSGWLPLGFFVVVVSLFPLGVGPDPTVLASLAPALIWVAALLAVLISLDRLYQPDYEDGSLDILSLSDLSLTGVVTAKVTAHWLATGLPLIVAAPVLGLLVNLPGAAMPILILTLLIGTPAMSLIGSIGAALTVSLKRGGLIIPIIVLPLYVPILIFGVLAVNAALAGQAPWAHIKLLAAMLIVAAVTGLWASVQALRLAAE